jgi:proteasome accessory factor C
MNAPRRHAGPRNAEARLRSLLVMLPWLMEAGEVPLADVANRFGLTEAEVTKDLELVAMCGLPPYVDEMIDVFVDDGMVLVGVPRLFTRPLRLTAPEAFALLVSARAVMELPGVDDEGPLARGLVKVAAALNDAGLAAPGDDTTGVALDFDRPPLTDELVEAPAAGAELALQHHSPSRAASTERVIVPRHVFADAGNWYVVADDDVSGERRTFRIDRITSIEATGNLHAIDPDAAPPESFFADTDLTKVTLRLAPAAQWIVDRYPIESTEQVSAPKTASRRTTTGESTAIDVVVPVASEWWLDRLLVRLGPDAEVLDPESAEAGAAALAARILAGYD